MSTAKPLRVNIVSMYFHPDLSGTGQLLTDLAIGLKRMGCDAFIYTTHPTFGSRARLKGFEIYEGVRIRRLFGAQFDKDSRVGRVLNEVTFFLSALWTLLTTRTAGPLLIVSHPAFLAFAGYLLRRLKGQRYIYLVHDVFPDAAVTLGYINPNGVVRKIWDWMNTLSVRNAARVVVLGESMKAIMLRKGGLSADPDKFHVIHNWVDEGFIRPLPRAENRFAMEHGLLGKFVVLYSGNIGRSQDLETVILAAERFQDRDAVFLFIGEGGKKQRLEALTRERGLRNVRFLPYQPREMLPFSLTCADVSLVALERGIEGLSMPSKLYAILASGSPVVALVEADFEIARIIATAGCGKSVAPSDVEGLASVLEGYYADRDACARDGRRGREYLEAHFGRERALREYYALIESVQ
jgi:glycosyltransferase involved in cell wall biosynthesis